MTRADPPGHPREAASLQAVEAPSAAFLRALAFGRLHHAWLLTGPEGVGKASFAYLAARRLLGAQPGPDGLSSAPGDPVSRMVAARSHPDLMVLERAGDEGPARRNIAVDDARRLPEFFAKSPAIAPFRVAIIDAADDLNVNAANAVLKTLEEPSGRGVLFLVSHAPGRLLATLRSRCRRLAFPPWPEDRVAAFVAARTGATPEEASRLAAFAHGSPGRALRLAAAGALELDDKVQRMVSKLPAVEEPELLPIADGFRGAEGADRFALTLDRIADRLRERALGCARVGEGAAGERWAELQTRAAALAGEAEGLNLDRADIFWTLVAELKTAAAAHPLAIG